MKYKLVDLVLIDTDMQSLGHGFQSNDATIDLEIRWWSFFFSVQK